MVDTPFCRVFGQVSKPCFMKQYRKETKLESTVYQVIITLTLIALPVFGHAATTEQALPAEVTETAGDGDGFDWNKLIDAIAHFESKGNARAVNGQYVGLLQISPVLVRECNNILKARGESKRYTLKDRYNAKKSREMFAIIQSHHNPSNSIERAIRIWKGGIGYSIRKTQNYVNRVLEHMGL